MTRTKKRGPLPYKPSLVLSPRLAGPFAPSAGWAALEKYVERSIREARRMLCKTREEGYHIEERGPQEWEGYAAALVNLRKKMKRTKEASAQRRHQRRAERKLTQHENQYDNRNRK